MPVIDDEAKKRWRKHLRRQQKGAAGFGQTADDHIERLLIRRFSRLVSVRRFVILWVGLLVLIIFATVMQIRWLSPYYQRLVPVAGGVYVEGLVGQFTNSNPLYASGTADAAVSRLVFSGLFKYDDTNRLVGDLASGYSLDRAQKIYTVSLRHDLKWQDGQPITADDVVFTYNTIQNPSSLSPLYSSWRDIQLRKVDNYRVNFILPNALSSFPYSLTNGIVPAHLLQNLDPEELRTAAFNIRPIGSGPFEWKFVGVSGETIDNRQQRISLEKNPDYRGGKSKLDGITLIAFASEQRLISAFEKKQINAMSGLENLPAELSGDKDVQVYNTPLTSTVMAFFNNSHPNLNVAAIRRALVRGVDRKLVESIYAYPVKLANEPLIPGQVGYNPSLAEESYNPSAAAKLLDGAGWKKGAGGLRYKNGHALQFQMASQDTKQYSDLAQFLQDQWGRMGVKINVSYFSSDDLQSQVIPSHSYDILLYGINLGVDPDEFAYWDSSQASLGSQGHLNLSEYKSSAADQALREGRTRSDPLIRAIKYKAFLSSWRKDTPALAIYQPNYLYITRGLVYGYGRKTFNSGIDRFYNISEWSIRQKRQTL